MRFGRRGAWVIGAAMLAVALTSGRASAAVTSVTFDIGHSDCTAPGAHTLNLFLNDVQVASVPTTDGCTCHEDSLVVTLTNPAVLALVNPAACNSARVVSPNGNRSLKLAWIRVSFATDDGAGATACIYDGVPWNEFLTCAQRSTCTMPGELRYLQPVGGADPDGDGITGGFGVGCDNCALSSNASQADADGDGIGDPCDNCPNVPNPDQADTDGDAIGDACDECALFPDWDGDGFCSDVDVCPNIYDPDQTDSDGDGVGDACDACMGPGTTDTDMDGVCDESDNCPFTANPSQADIDGDGLGDACDGCDGPGADADGDGVCDGEDLCPSVPDPAQADADGDGVGNACDNCPLTPNPTQSDGDGDGTGDACDVCPGGADSDGDGVCDATDNCPMVANADQADQDADNVGDVCDDCPAVFDPAQADTDADGVADACSVGVTVMALTNDGNGTFDADVAMTSPSGGPLAGTVEVHDAHGVSALRFAWLASSCTLTQDTLDLTINGTTVARVVPEPNGPFCACSPFVHEYHVPLARALALLHPGVNELGVRKSSGLPAQQRTYLAWAYGAITVDAVEHMVPIFDWTGTGLFTTLNMCTMGSTAGAVDAAADTDALPAPPVGMSWTEHLPCGVALGSVPNGPFRLLVTATDGDTIGADVRDAMLTMPSSMTFTGASCDDGNPCTIDVCGAAGCEHTPVVCEGGASGCNDAPSCDPSTGQCVAAPKADGSSCDDGNTCTTGETCTAGACGGGQPMVCEGAAGPCEDAPTCDPSTGTCMPHPKADGTSCDDGNPCTMNDVCNAGACTAGAPKTCEGSATACQEAPSCDPSSGQCVVMNKPNGTSCDDGNACTTGDVCNAGQCAAGAPVVCTGGDACHDAGTCDPATGQCAMVAKPDGTRCEDGNACTQLDSCQAGTCTGGAPLTCTASDACHDAGTCDPSTGMCSNPAKADGASCNDGNACTFNESCHAGACGGGQAVTCNTPGDACHEAATCNPSTGQCENAPKPDGTPCADANKCTQTDTCQAGACTGGDPVICEAPNDCFTAMCKPRSGRCKVKRVEHFRQCMRELKGNDKPKKDNGKGKKK